MSLMISQLCLQLLYPVMLLVIRPLFQEHAALIRHPSHKRTFIHVHVPRHVRDHVHVFHLREHRLVNPYLVE